MINFGIRPRAFCYDVAIKRKMHLNAHLVQESKAHTAMTFWSCIINRSWLPHKND